MFGLEKQKKKSGANIELALEKELKNASKKRALVIKIEERLGKLKALLRTGEHQEVFQALGTLFHGYSAALKTVTRAK